MRTIVLQAIVARIVFLVLDQGPESGCEAGVYLLVAYSA